MGESCILIFLMLPLGMDKLQFYFKECPKTTIFANFGFATSWILSIKTLRYFSLPIVVYNYNLHLFMIKDILKFIKKG